MKKSLKVRYKKVQYERTLFKKKRTEFVPSLMLAGKWFEQLGFGIGSQVQVEAKEGTLIISKI